jgi:hypothetical protein
MVAVDFAESLSFWAKLVCCQIKGRGGNEEANAAGVLFDI